MAGHQFTYQIGQKTFFRHAGSAYIDVQDRSARLHLLSGVTQGQVIFTGLEFGAEQFFARGVHPFADKDQGFIAADAHQG